jgi:hypothetical protein
VKGYTLNLKVVAIIAEYNPFHNGHAHHIAETRKKTGCDYCPYASVCGFDKKNGGRYRVLAPLADEEVFARLCKEEGKD